MNIIFLDIDGVLNSMPYFESLKNSGETEYQEISDYHLSMLAKIYHACDAKIVLSSTWRELDDKSDETVYAMYQYLIDSLARYGMEIISKTPFIGLNRPLEIVSWLKSQKDDEDIRFVSLDDDFTKEEYEKYGIGENLVKTEFFCKSEENGGLQQRHVDQAIKILKSKKNGGCYGR